jgi:hypothetical protein
MLAGQVWVDHNPYGDGERTLLYYFINKNGDIDTNIHNQNNIKNDGYDYVRSWYTEYKGSFELVLPYTQFTKPEVYQVGDIVEVLENVAEIGYGNPSHNSLYGIIKNMIGKQNTITCVDDNIHGVFYKIDGRSFPSYCVRRVENPIKEMTQAQIEQELGYKINIIE